MKPVRGHGMELWLFFKCKGLSKPRVSLAVLEARDETFAPEITYELIAALKRVIMEEDPTV